MAKPLQKMYVLLWKHAVVRTQNKIMTLVHIFLPIILIFGVLYLFKDLKKIDAETYPSQDPHEVLNSSSLNSNTRIYYAPSTRFTSKLMKSVKNALKKVTGNIFGVKNEDDILHAFNTSNDDDSVEFIGIIFHDIKEVQLPKTLKYCVRSKKRLKIKQTFQKDDSEGPTAESGQYIASGIGALQLYIDSSFIDIVRKEAGHKDINEESQKMRSSSLVSVEAPEAPWPTTVAGFPFQLPFLPSRIDVARLVQKFPHPVWTNKPLYHISNFFSFALIFGFLFFQMSLLRDIGSERETGVKEIMKLNGLKSWIIYTCWLIDCLCMNIISVAGIVLVLKLGVGNVPPLLKTTDGSLLWAFLTMFRISSIFFMFAISSILHDPLWLQLLGMLLYVAPQFVSKFITPGRTTDLLLSLFPVGGFSYGINIIFQYELRGNGLQWNNVMLPPVGNPDHMTMGEVFITYSIGIIIFILITCYMDAVKPGKYGVAKPWYFLCLVCFNVNDSIKKLETQDIVTENYETAPDYLKAGIRIKDLYKMYSSDRISEAKMAVNGVTLDIYKGEITALLGHNGAGKTTIMSIISGMMSGTSGSVIINGYDTKKDMEIIRKNIGLCPQHSILIDNLTVEDHLIFFGMLKGQSKETAKDMSNEILHKLDLSGRKSCFPSQLSGGMKRKLSLAVALAGDVNVLILDEPTSGMDVEARREVWNLLLSLRGQKTILISTHYMEEADVLGDRVAIMDHGKIKCYGTTLFLKKRYGNGYTLCVIKLDGCNESSVWEIISKNIPEATIKSLIGSLIYFSLPFDQASKFPKLFESLEGNKEKLRIGGFGVSITTLEDVFLNVGTESEDEASESDIVRSATNDELYAVIDATGELTRFRARGLKLIFRQFSALLLNNVLYTYRNFGSDFMKVFLLLSMTYLTINKSKFLKPVSDTNSEYVFSLNNYGNTDVFLRPGLCHEGLIQSYKKEIESTSSTLTVISSYDDLNEVLLQQAVSNVAKFREKIIVAAEFKCHEYNVQANAMYSNVALHGFPTSVNIMSNALLKFISSDFSIIFSYHPFKTEGTPDNSGFYFEIVFVFGIWFGVVSVLTNFVEFPLTERMSKSKQIKLMAGVNPITYWLSHFLWDFVCYSIPMIIVPALIIISDTQGLFNKMDMLGVLLIILIIYGIAGIPFMHFLSFLAPSLHYASDFCTIGSVIAIVAYFVVILLRSFKPEWSGELKTADTVLHLIPPYTLASSLKIYITITSMRIYCMVLKTSGCQEDMSYFDDNLPDELNLKRDLMFIGIHCLLYFFIVLLIEFRVIKNIYTLTEKLIFGKRTVRDDNDDDDDDVKLEELRVKNQIRGIEPKDALLVYNLVKHYRSFPAVKGISFGVSEGECFGLLGTNGAGKTTSFQVLTGDLVPNSGRISAFGYKLSKNRRKYLSHIGYCPQFDALDQHLTGEQVLSLYAKLRGLPKNIRMSQINSWINLLGLTEFSNKICGTYSGGNKRKLSAAIALIGNPPVVFLDEPTTGVDPVSRRMLWNILGKIQKTGQIVVLTSHSMEECEALCSRLAIMVSGKFVCIGNIQYLKQKFGQGHIVIIRTKSSVSAQNEVTAVKSWFEEKKYPDSCRLTDEHLGLLEYHITDPDVTMKQLFTTLEEMKRNFNVIEDYAVSQTTLEQIFLYFAKKNRD